MKIDCQSCVMYRTSHCDDCLVTALLHAPTDSIEIPEEDESPLQALSGAGLIPVLRFRPRTVPEPPATPEAGPGARDPLADAG
jgi:hypothetical protein